MGSWLNNRKNGYGVFYYHTGAIYEGNFVDDLRDGQGKITFLKGSAVEESYEGTWVKDEWHGYGVYRYRKEEGEWNITLIFVLFSAVDVSSYTCCIMVL